MVGMHWSQCHWLMIHGLGIELPSSFFFLHRWIMPMTSQLSAGHSHNILAYMGPMYCSLGHRTLNGKADDNCAYNMWSDVCGCVDICVCACVAYRNGYLTAVTHEQYGWCIVSVLVHMYTCVQRMLSLCVCIRAGRAVWNSDLCFHMKHYQIIPLLNWLIWLKVA